jgi:hypothetical protein
VQVAAAALAGRDAGHPSARQARCWAKAHDCPSEEDRDFLLAGAEPRQLAAPMCRDVPEWRQVRRLPDELRKAVCRPKPPILPLRAHLTALQVQQDESVLSLARPLWVPQARLAVPPGEPLSVSPSVQERVPSALREQSLAQRMQAQPALVKVPGVLPVHWVWSPQAQQLASSVRPSQPLLSLPFPLRQQIPLALRPRQPPEASPALFQRRRPG